MNDKITIELGYRKTSLFSTDKIQYFAQPHRNMIVWQTITVVVILANCHPNTFF